jgi:hypothetical protein
MRLTTDKEENSMELIYISGGIYGRREIGELFKTRA